MDIKILFSFYPLFVNYNHGIALLSAICKQRGIDTELYMLDESMDFERYLQNSKPDMVGFSCVTEQDYLLSLPFIRIAKESGFLTMLGGVYPRRGLPLFNNDIDGICRGDGEGLPDFLIDGNTQLFAANMVWGDLNDLPLPDYELFKNIPYNRELPFLTGAKLLPYSSSRGCPFKCSFCETRFQYPQVRIRTRVEEDLTYLVGKYNPDAIIFGDELLPYYDQGWKDSWENFSYPFVAYIRADIKEQDLRWLYDRGLSGCFFGVESGNENHRNNGLNKCLTDHDLWCTANLLREMQIPYMASYMQNTPGENWKLKAETMKMSKEIGGYPVFYQYTDLARSI